MKFKWWASLVIVYINSGISWSIVRMINKHHSLALFEALRSYIYAIPLQTLFSAKDEETKFTMSFSRVCDAKSRSYSLNL